MFEGGLAGKNSSFELFGLDGFEDFLEAIQTEQLEGRILSREPALEHLRALASETD